MWKDFTAKVDFKDWSFWLKLMKNAEISRCQILQMFFCKQWDRWNMQRPPLLQWEKTFMPKIHFGLRFSLFNMLNQGVFFILEISDMVHKRGPVSKNWVSWYKKKNHGNVYFLMAKKVCILGLIENFFF